MSDDLPLDTRALRFEITVSADERFRPVLGPICRRVAGYVGFSDAELTDLEGDVERIVTGLLAGGALSTSAHLDVSVLTTERDITFRLASDGVELQTVTKSLPHAT